MILDNACGASALVTSQLTHMLPVELMEEAQLIATDLSGKVVAEATRRLAELNWADHVFTFKMAQEDMLGLNDASLTHVLTNFGIHLTKDVGATLKEMKRVLVPGGICALTVWKHLPWLDVLAKAITEEYPKRPMPFPCHEDALLSLTRWNPWHDVEWIKKTIEEAGFFACQANGKTINGACGDSESDEAPNDNKEDWSQYEYDSGGSRSPSRRNSKTCTLSPSSSLARGFPATPSLYSSLTSVPHPASCNEAESHKGPLIIEEVSSIHRYTKHEFMSSFGTSVLDHLISASWGKQSIEKEETRSELRQALFRYLIKLCPDQSDEIELDLKALVVVIRKDAKRDVPTQM